VLGSGFCYEQRKEVDINVGRVALEWHSDVTTGRAACELCSATRNYGKPKVHLNHIFRYGSYLTENNSISNYKHQPVNVFREIIDLF
jgi:hypothetical protein